MDSGDIYQISKEEKSTILENPAATQIEATVLLEARTVFRKNGVWTVPFHMLIMNGKKTSVLISSD